MLLVGKQKVYSFVGLFLIFLSNGTKYQKNLLNYIFNASSKQKLCFNSVHSTLDVNECNLHLEKQES